MFWFNEFNGVRITPMNFSTGIPRAFQQNRTVTTGGEGEYDRNGIRNPMTQQTYSHEVTVRACDFQAKWDELLGSAAGEGVLKKTNGTQTRFTSAKITNIVDATTDNDWAQGAQRIGLQFSAEPYWYDNTLTTTTFSYQSTVIVNNQGNARALKHAVLTLTPPPTSIYGVAVYGQSRYSNPSGVYLTGGVAISITPVPKNAKLYGSMKWGTGKYQGLPGSQAATRLTYPVQATYNLVIDFGKDTIQEAGTDRYSDAVMPCTQAGLLWLEAGKNIVRFSVPVYGMLQFRNTWI